VSANASSGASSDRKLSAVLDPVQLARIQGTHRGFLYQHLYAVVCLLAAPRTGVRVLRVERDEDVELVLDGETIYAQVKTRSAPLMPSDLEGVLGRFDAIRAAHQSGTRAGTARFAIVSNVELGPTLAQQSWPSDVEILTPLLPAANIPEGGLHLPPSDVEGLIRTAIELAEGHRLSVLRPESLVLKLVGLVAAAAAGTGSDTSFAASDLARFCEFIAAQVRPLPVVENYRPQLREPTIPAQNTPVIVIGHTGDGKSAWAAQIAVHASETAVYLSCSSAPGEQIAPRFVDAAVTTLVARGTVHAHELVLPGRTGIDALALLDAEIAHRGLSLLAIVDDCHHVAADLIVAAIRAAPNVRWILLGRPTGHLNEVAAQLGVGPQLLGGWSADTIATLLAAAGCSTNPMHVANLRQVTGGAPLFVLHAIRAIHEGDRDTEVYARALLAGTTPGRPAQEILLEGTVNGFSPEIKRVTSALACVELSLPITEWAKEIATALSLQETAVLRALRQTVEIGVTIATEGALIYLHDAFRPLVVERFISAGEARALREQIAARLQHELLHDRVGERIVAYARILASLGRMSELADIANSISEMIRETGTISEIREHLEAALAQDVLGNEDAFWALDTLAFFDIVENDTAAAAARLPRMHVLAATLGDSVRGSLLHKEALVAWKSRDIAALRSLVSACPPDHSHSRILRYHGALGEADVGNIDEAVRLLLGIANEYQTELGLTSEAILLKNPDDLLQSMKADADPVDARHLADCYDAITKYTLRDPQYCKFGALMAACALKLYDLVGASRAALLAGQNVVDALIGVLRDPPAARDFMEKNLLPTAARVQLAEMTLPIRIQYAVVCAYCGDFTAADAEISRLTPYILGLSGADREEVDKRLRLVEELRAQAAVLSRGKVGRNEPCPCGSGKKFKKCCGRSW
jgi:hypothetical protein